MQIWICCQLSDLALLLLHPSGADQQVERFKFSSGLFLNWKINYFDWFIAFNYMDFCIDVGRISHCRHRCWSGFWCRGCCGSRSLYCRCYWYCYLVIDYCLNYIKFDFSFILLLLGRQSCYSKRNHFNMFKPLMKLHVVGVPLKNSFCAFAQIDSVLVDWLLLANCWRFDPGLRCFRNNHRKLRSYYFVLRNALNCSVSLKSL